MSKILHAKASDLPSLNKCFRRVQGDMEAKGLNLEIEEFLFGKEIEEGHLYVVKEGIRVIGAALVSFVVEDVFFPQSKSQRKVVSLLDEFDYQDEGILILTQFFIDPAYQHQGVGSMLLEALSSAFKGYSILLSLNKENHPAISFFQKHGFVNYGNQFELEIEGKENIDFFAKKPKKDGLCRNIGW